MLNATLRRIGLITLLSCGFSYLFISSVPSISGQATCPPAILLDLSRAASTCYGMEHGQVCAGNGNVTAADFDASLLLVQPGDRTTGNNLQTLTLTSTSDDLAVAFINAQGGLPISTERRVTLLLFGDVTITNHTAPLPEITALATGSANIRSAPQADAQIIGRANVNDGLVLNGRSSEGAWVRTRVPDTDLIGWVTLDVLNVQGNINSLVIASADETVSAAFDSMTVQISDTAACDGRLAGGILIQTPSPEQAARFHINDVEYAFSGTSFLSMQNGAWTVTVLTGYTLIGYGGQGLFVPAGAFTDGIQAPQPFDPAQFGALPLMLLPLSVRLPTQITPDDITRLTDAYWAAQAAINAAPLPSPTPDPTICRRVTRTETTLYAGPGDFYEAINEMPAGRNIAPVLQTADPDGRAWWQLSNSNWLIVSDVRETGECPDVPVAQVVPPPPTNTLSLETCETTNGPLRTNQRVTIQFTPPAFDNYGEARDATIIDPGRITINADTYRTRASDLILLGTVGEEDERYLRRFSITWIASPGTYRIVGDRLVYEPICTITVPVG